MENVSVFLLFDRSLLHGCTLLAVSVEYRISLRLTQHRLRVIYTGMGESEKLSFVLPVALKEPYVEPWRGAPDQALHARLKILLASFAKMFNHSDLKDLWIICPPDQIEPIAAIIADETSDGRYRVISEMDLEPIRVAKSGRAVGGWRIQQMIKLAMAERVGTNAYVTLDNDIICTKPFSMRSLMRGNRALVGVETIADYLDLYLPHLARAEKMIELRRYGEAEQLLLTTRPLKYKDRFYSETPVILFKEVVELLTARLEACTGQPWPYVLANRRRWTEYTLYFLMLEISGRFEDFYEAGHRSCVMDIDQSIWHPINLYRRSRDLSRWTPFESHADSEAGPFLSIQSYLPSKTWLPKVHNSVEDFYALLQQKLACL
jgi:hypothetical protein